MFETPRVPAGQEVEHRTASLDQAVHNPDHDAEVEDVLQDVMGKEQVEGPPCDSRVGSGEEFAVGEPGAGVGNCHGGDVGPGDLPALGKARRRIVVGSGVPTAEVEPRPWGGSGKPRITWAIRFFFSSGHSSM